MLKVTISKSKITTKGGLYFVEDLFNRCGIRNVINNCFGSRAWNAQYDYSDIVLQCLLGALSGGRWLRDYEALRAELPGAAARLASQDTIEYAVSELMAQNEAYGGEGKYDNQLNVLPSGNLVLLQAAQLLGLLPKSGPIPGLDYDNVVIKNRNSDARNTYKGNSGYSPVFVLYDRIPVYIECRNGNTSAKTWQVEAVSDMIDSLQKAGLTIGSIRQDCASYNAELTDMYAKDGIKFYIRALSSKGLSKLAYESPQWKRVNISGQDCELHDFKYKLKSGNKAENEAEDKKKNEFRIVCKRMGGETPPNELYPVYEHYYIITNDFESSNAEIVEHYQKRGDSEKTNGYMLGDFNLAKLPFHNMPRCTVYMYIMGLCAIFFEYLKKVLVDNKVQAIELKMRTKAIMKLYIFVAAKWVWRSKQKTLLVYTDNSKKYFELQI